jgi:hypothetical protein
VNLSAEVTTTTEISLGELTAIPPSHGYGEQQRLLFSPTTSFTTLAFSDTSAATVSVDIALDQVTLDLVQPEVWLESSTGMVLCWNSVAERTYQVQDPTDWGSAGWTDLGAPVEGHGDIVRIELQPSGALCRYFRVVRLP